MREIKFRLRDENNQIVGYETWSLGAFNIESKKDYYVLIPSWIYSKDSKAWFPGYINHRYKDQYTNHQDKNGKEIYENDFIKITEDFIKNVNSSYYGKNFGKVIYQDGGYLFGEEVLDYVISKAGEIIGNEFENPELLEKVEK